MQPLEQQDALLAIEAWQRFGKGYTLPDSTSATATATRSPGASPYRCSQWVGTSVATDLVVLP